MNIKFLKTKHKLLAYCIEDWTPLFFIAAFVREFYLYKDLELIKKTTLEIARKLLEKKIIIAGDLLADNTFIKWNGTIDEIIIKIKNKWDNLDRKLIPHEIVWFKITEKGKKEFEYLNNISELQDPIYYFRIFEGGQKKAEEILNRLASYAQLIKNDKLRKIKVYKLVDNSQFCYREHSKFGMRIITIDIKLSDIKKYIQYKFTENYEIKIFKSKT